VIRECSTPGCSTLTFGDTCLGCDQKNAGVQRTFPRGRPFSRANAADGAAASNDASGVALDTRAT
jgi:hypothetical protein